MINMIKSGERIDDLQCKGYSIIQNPKGFCFGIDAVFLANYVRVKPNARVLDLGTGTGIIPLLLAGKTDAREIVGLEIQEESADMASRSVAYNALENRIKIVHGDIKRAAELFSAASFQTITCNPPYMVKQEALENPYAPKNIARHEILCTFEDVAKATAYLVQPGGSLYLVHKPFRLAEIIYTLKKYKLEPKRMRLIHPYVNKEPSLVLIEAVRGGGVNLRVEPPVIIYQEAGVYTEEVGRMYRGEGRL